MTIIKHLAYNNNEAKNKERKLSFVHYHSHFTLQSVPFHHG